MTSHDFLFEQRSYKDLPRWNGITPGEWNDPRWQLKNSIRDVDGLAKVVRLTEAQKKHIGRTIARSRKEGKDALRITPYYAMLIAENPFHPSYPDGETLEGKLDPVFWQSVPTPASFLFPNSGTEAAMAEGDRSYGAAYQRYPNRVALFVGENTSCAAYCQHCQRGKSLDGSTSIRDEDLKKGLFYIALNENIQEVLITGGDALRVGKERLRYVLEELAKVEHIHSIRIATRVPVTMPMGVTEELLEVIDTSTENLSSGPRKNVYFMTHLNHYHEVTQEFMEAVQRIKAHGYSIRNQTVLMRHINDDFATLAETFRSVSWAGVDPYYVFQCHNERGLTHFITPIALGQTLIGNMQGWLSGSCRPTYAVNAKGGGGKVLLMPSGYDPNNERQRGNTYHHSATLHTWDDRTMLQYQELGRAKEPEFRTAEQTMEEFIGRPGVFRPCVNIVDSQGNYIRTTNLDIIPELTNKQKARMLGYEARPDGMPVTNPAKIAQELDAKFRESTYCVERVAK